MSQDPISPDQNWFESNRELWNQKTAVHINSDFYELDAFKQGHDIHALTASQVFSIPLDSVDSAHRRRAKAINFGIIYGQSAFGLARGLGIERSEAKAYIEQYFTQYPHMG